MSRHLKKIGLLKKSTFRVYYKISISYFSPVQMSLFYQRGHILHFFRSFSIFRQGSCLISLYPIFSPSFSEFSLSFPSLSSPSNPVSSISCDVPEFSPSLLSRTLEKGAFLQSAVTVSSSIASQKLYGSSTQTLPQLHHTVAKQTCS